MTFLDAVVPNSLRRHRSSDNQRPSSDTNATASKSSDGGEIGEEHDDYEHIGDEHTYEHIDHRESNGQHSEHRQSSGATYMENGAQHRGSYTHDQIGKDPEEKKLGGSAPDLKLADFELIKTLGTGTFARVWLTRFKKTIGKKQNQVFALKVLRKVDVIRLKQVQHIQNERITLAAVAGHPFITTLVLTFRDSNSIYMLLDYCPGGELFTYLRRQKKFEEPAAMFYAAEIVLVFEYLHDKQGVVYRDLKPENILLDERGHVKLVDFGFAKVLSKQETRTYTLCGTPEYLAPEIIKNTGHGFGVDWWALGIIIYEFLNGQPPFWSQDPMRIYHKIAECDLKFPSSAKYSDAAKDIMSGLIKANPSERLGCIYGGSQTVKEHEWFKCVDWEMLYKKRMDGPIVPNVQSDDDSNNFDDYPDEDPKERKEYTDKLRKQWDSSFDDF